MPSDTTIIELNSAIDAAIRLYLPTDPPIDIVFDIPDPEKTPEAPTVSVFLFDLQEDLELRASQQRVWDKTSHRLNPGFVNVACRYLITYWGTVNEGSGSPLTASPDSQNIRIMNAVMNALINHRSFPTLPGSFTRIIPPMDLNSLGTFWQALGNKPRLCLGYSCTVPVALNDGKDLTPVGKDFELEVIPKAAG
jgi:hypothetical protein